MLTGNLSETPFADLIQLYTLSRQTAALTIVSPVGPEHDGIIYVENGDLVDARFGDASGAEAVRRALRLTEGEFRVELNVRARHRTIFEPWSKLVLDEMVAGDEAARNAPDEVEIEQEESMFPKSQPEPVRRKSALPIAITSAVVVAATIGGIFYWRGVKEQQEAAAIAEREAAVAAARHVAEAQQKAARPNVPGVTDTEITFGISAPFSGPAKELGRGMKSGIDIAFAAVNEAGGVNGRKLKLVALDDGYEPERTKAAMKELAETRKVFGFVGNVGYPHRRGGGALRAGEEDALLRPLHRRGPLAPRAARPLRLQLPRQLRGRDGRHREVPGRRAPHRARRDRGVRAAGRLRRCRLQRRGQDAAQVQPQSAEGAAGGLPAQHLGRDPGGGAGAATRRGRSRRW